MFRYLFRTVQAARNSPASVYESCVLLTKCDTAPGFRVANGRGAKALSTSSVKFCDKNNVASSNQDEKTNADQEADPTETPTLVTQKTEDDSKVIKMAEQSEEPVVLKTDDGSTTQQHMDVKVEQVVAPPKQVKTDAGKSGKESIFELLSTLKVEVTNKRTLNNLKPKQNHDSTVEASSQRETLGPELTAAASAAASTLPNSSQAVSELLQQLRQQEAVTEAQKKGDMNNLGVIIADMKVGKNPNRKSRTGNPNWFDEEESQQRAIWNKRMAGNRLHIFSPTAAEEGVESTVARPTLWDTEFAHELSVVTNQYPRNGFEEMIQWTKEGQLWQYPINNEAGLEEEASVSFHEHIFLEKHLEEGFPRQGPVRHFMELVVAGLSKNPYLTVQQKKEHISWFRDYFHQKQEVLKEADVYLN